MSTLNPVDFGHLTVVPLDGIKVEPATIARLAIEAAIGGVAHVLIHSKKDGTTTWTPTWRPDAENDPGHPIGFPSVLAGYGRNMGEVIDKWRHLSAIEWRDATNGGPEQALVFQNAEDADAFLAGLAEQAAGQRE